MNDILARVIAGELCARCGGLGETADGETCPACEGSGVPAYAGTDVIEVIAMAAEELIEREESETAEDDDG